MLNLPNALTCSRFVTGPVFLWLLLGMTGTETAARSWAALAVLVVTLLTDMFDGILARAQQQVTDFGKVMDPVADSTFFMTFLFAFSAAPRFSVAIWLPLIVLYREVAMHVLRRYAALRGIVMAARTSGKAKMAAQSVVAIALLLAIACKDSGYLAFDERAAAFWVVAFIAAVNILSLPEYLLQIPAIRNPRTPRGQ